MRRIGVRVAVVAVVMGGASLAFAKLDGPPVGKTGAPAMGGYPSESNCTGGCHEGTGNLNLPEGSVDIIVPATFEADQEVPVTVVLNYTHDPVPPDPLHWGFQLTAVRPDSGRTVGSFIVPADLQIKSSMSIFVGRQYVEHTANALHTGESGPVQWTFTWKAPSYPVPRMYFYAAGNAGNGDGTENGDFIFTTMDSSLFSGPLSVPNHLATLDLRSPQPNPFSTDTDLAYAIPTEGHVDLAIFDLQGRRIRTLVSASRPPGPGVARWDGARDDGRRAASGVYFARLELPGSPAISRRLVYSR